MVDATKNKRGRPKKELYAEFTTIEEWIDSDKSRRAKQNLLHAEAAFWNMSDENQRFFMDGNGNIKRLGIIEQLGRMMHEGIIAEDEVNEWAEKCISMYNNGYTSKDIEQMLRNLRKQHKPCKSVPNEPNSSPFNLNQEDIERYKWLAEHQQEVEAAIMKARDNNKSVTPLDVLKET